MIRFNPGRGTRAEDDAVLEMIRLRCALRISSRVSDVLGISQERIRVATDRVRKADLAESGEPPVTVNAAYTWAGIGEK